MSPSEFFAIMVLVLIVIFLGALVGAQQVVKP
jgi:hypothetical protein